MGRFNSYSRSRNYKCHDHSHGQRNHYSGHCCGYRSVSASSCQIVLCDKMYSLELLFAKSHCLLSLVFEVGVEKRCLASGQIPQSHLNRESVHSSRAEDMYKVFFSSHWVLKDAGSSSCIL